MENIEVPETEKQRRKSIKNEIEKAVEERQKVHDEVEKRKDLARSKLFPEIAKEVQEKSHDKN